MLNNYKMCFCFPMPYIRPTKKTHGKYREIFPSNMCDIYKNKKKMGELLTNMKAKYIINSSCSCTY